MLRGNLHELATVFSASDGKQFRTGLGFAAALVSLTLSYGDGARAAEGGIGAYLLGARGPMAGFTPPPGVYFQNDVYLYDGSGGRERALPFHGQLVGDLRAKVWIELPTLIWATPLEVLGGHLNFSISQPIGGPSIDAGLSFSSRFLPGISRSAHDSIATYGDPYASTFIGWHAGNFHWLAGVSANIPAGDYRDGALANIAFHHWATDVYGAVTWFDPKIGLDLSVAAGMTFNGENPATQYRSGNEFHLEWAAEQHLSEQFSAGLIGYYYQQVTGDSGDGARLGDFKGRVVALGGTVGYAFKLGELPVQSRIKVLREFDVENRLEGTSAFITFSLPLAVQTPAAVKASAVRVTR